MQIPVEILLSPIKGGCFEASGSTGRWWKRGKLIASWRRAKDGRAIVEWNREALKKDGTPGKRECSIGTTTRLTKV